MISQERKRPQPLLLQRILPQTLLLLLLLLTFETVGNTTTAFKSNQSFKHHRHLDRRVYVYESKKWPHRWSSVPSLGNGHLGMVLKYPWFYVSGFYNGAKRNSHRAKIPSTTSLYLVGISTSASVVEPVSEDTVLDRFKISYQLDTRVGIFTEKHTNKMFCLTLSWYVHRSILPLLVFQAKIKRKYQNKLPKSTRSNTDSSSTDDYKSHHSKLSDRFGDDVTIRLNISRNCQSEDMKVVEFESPFNNTKFYSGTTLEAESIKHSSLQTIHWIHDVIPNQLVLQKFERSKTWSYLTSVHFSKDVVLKAYKLGKNLQRKNNDELRKIHQEKWLKLWKKGRIEMKGVSENATRLTKAITSSLYNLLSSLPDFSNENNLFGSQWKQKESYLFTGLSPSGLSWGDRKAYMGHLFWDQETWMYPPLLMLHQSSAQLMLQARLRTMYTAGGNAKIEGFVGMKYPWESALTGIEVSPDRECGIREIHINGDISLAVLQYLRVTDHNLTCQSNDLSEVPKLIIGIADYWLNRSVWNNSSLRFEISCVMPPDEYSRCVNNSAYTNVVARISLKLAFEVAECLKLPNSTVYENAFKRMYVPFDEQLNYHPEYDGYVLGKIVKQADVVLLGFPLMYNMLPDVRRRDLEIYENVTSVKGPAMSDAMFTVGWLEVHEPDKARRSFEKMFDHVTGDFQVWTEVKGGHGAPNFITGMGGYLQSILFGYFGIRIYRDKLLINPELPTDISSMALYGLDYKNCSLDIFVGDRNEMVIKWSRDVGCSRLLIASPTERLRLSGSRKMTISKSSLYIRVIRERGTNDACFP